MNISPKLGVVLIFEEAMSRTLGQELILVWR
jgi:hypothetical protein